MNFKHGSLKESIFVIGLIVTAVILLSTATSNDEHTTSPPSYSTAEVPKDEAKSPGIGVSTDNPEATKVGMDVLTQGGNAIDAAIAISYSLGVLEPHASGIGGGGIMLIHPADGSDPVVYDYRETAPDQVEKPESAIGIPGFVMGMDTVHNDYGSWSMERLINPAIKQAEDGVDVSYSLYDHLQNASDHIYPQGTDFFYPDDRAIQPGSTLQQEELAETMRAIRDEGPDVFYDGKLGEDLAARTDALSTTDLLKYEVALTEPVHTEFSGFDAYAAPPPVGGTMLLHSLQMAEELQIDQLENRPSEFMKLLGAITRKAYQDRVQTIGDPNFVDIPLEEIMEREYARDLASDVALKASDEEFPVDLEGDKDGNTTHFVVVDHNGTMVSVTNTLSSFFGSGVFTNGFFLNNQLDNFSESTTSPNAYEPNKRPISYITPTILSKDSTPLVGIGSSGGRRITSTLSQVLIRHLMFDQPIEDAIEENRSYYDLHSPVIYVEVRVSPEVKESLEEDGYTVDNSRNAIFYGSVQSLIVDYNEGTVYGGSDSRRDGEWQAR